MVQNVLIIGGSRGVGLGLTKKYASNPNFKVFVTCRSNEGGLKDISGITVVRNIDIGNDELIEKLKSSSIFPDKIDLIICNAGMKDSSQELNNLEKPSKLLVEYDVNALG